MTEGPDRLEPIEREQPATPAPPRLGEPAPDLRVCDETGTEVWLHDLWGRTPRGLALVFVRQFSDSFCRAHVALLREMRERFNEQGVRVAIVGMGTSEQCARFRNRNTLPFPVLADPERAAYRAYGLIGETSGQAWGMPEIAGRFKLASRGILPGWPTGNARQLAGDFLIDRDGILRYSRISRRASDIPPPDALLAAAHELL